MAGFDAASDVPRRSPLWWQLHDAPYDETLYLAEFVTRRTINFITESADSGDPFMTWCSFPDPHHPLSPPAKWRDRHSVADIPLPTTYDDPGEGWPAHLSLLRSLRPHHTNFVRPVGPTPEQVRACIATRYGMIEFIDEGIGRILATLESLGVAENTIVIFTSDHGDMMGDHGPGLPLKTRTIVSELGRYTRDTDGASS
jgi:arylsulfatase A-like enzyme